LTSVLIAALSGRALAASARRAGLTPLVVDAFGDADTRAAAAALRYLPEAAGRGFRTKSLCAALDDLLGAAPTPPIGLVLGSGFEDTPRLVAALARRYPLLGNTPDAIRRAKDPATFFPLLDGLGIAHPETRLSPPEDAHGWLSKRTGASGGAHVVEAERFQTRRGRYYQRRQRGDPTSLLALAEAGQTLIVGISEQRPVGSGPRPYRYAGAAGPARLDAAAEAQMTRAASSVAAALGLRGLISFDFVVSAGEASLLEVNPRPSATIDVFDSPDGALLNAHIAACRGDAARLPSAQPPRATAILYADAGPLRIGHVDWPSWTADRPMPQTRIPRYRPIATVLAGGDSVAAAQRMCRQRLEDLAEMVYGRAPDREHKNAKTDRSRAERLGAGGQAR
jgi:predicted ATP-grasp superfamily ATP-dependent carboligase